MLDAKHLPRTYSNSAVTLGGWLIWVDNSYEAEISELSLFSMKVKVVSSQVGLFFHVFQWYFYHGFGHFSIFNVQICSCCAHRPSAKTLVSVPRNPPLPEEAIKYFSSLSQTMLSLFMSISGGVSWEELVFPLQDWLHIT